MNLSQGEDPFAAAEAFSRGRGVDGVLITASTKSNEPVHQAAEMCRKRGRIVLVGVVGLELSRADFYEKELSFQVSCSYGPGRYDPLYEEAGQDYPVGFVRWTEQRNFEAVLDMLADGRLDVSPLISHRFTLDQVEEAYRVVGGEEPSLGILLKYPEPEDLPEEQLRAPAVRLTKEASQGHQAGDVVVGFIGAGNYATSVLIPAFRDTSARLKSVASRTGVSGVHAGKKYGVEEATTDSDSILNDEEINAVVISTRHDSHAKFVMQALSAGKHVFVEKPLTLNRAELNEVDTLYSGMQVRPLLMVGFNRRFAPHVVKIRELLSGVQEPRSFIMTVNAGAIPSDHWTQDPLVGGGRIIGEGCHFIDLLRFLADSEIVDVKAESLGAMPGLASCDDNVTFTLAFADGSFGAVHYLANGHKSFPKERLEVFCSGRILQLDNFRSLRGYGWPGFRKMNLWRQDKGNGACAAAFVDAIKSGKASPIPFGELVEVTGASFDIVDQIG